MHMASMPCLAAGLRDQRMLAGQAFTLLLMPALIVARNRWKAVRVSAP